MVMFLISLSFTEQKKDSQYQKRFDNASSYKPMIINQPKTNVPVMEKPIHGFSVLKKTPLKEC